MYLIKYYCCIIFVCGSCNYSTYKTVSGPAVLTSKKSIPIFDWVGTYKGILPDRNCDRVPISIILKKNCKYTFYRENTNTKTHNKRSKGRFKWDRLNDRVIQINNGRDTINLQIEGNRLRVLSLKDCLISDSLIIYKIRKTIEWKSWKIIEILGISVERSSITQHINFSDDKLRGGFNCFGVQGKYIVSENNTVNFNSISFSNLPCIDSNKNVQGSFLRAINNTRYYNFNNDTLNFIGTNKEQLMKSVLIN